MDNLETPIKSLDQAEAFFKAMGCSGFHMVRESPDRHSEYRLLNIPDEIEIKWITEELNEKVSRIESNQLEPEASWQHSRAVDLYMALRVRSGDSAASTRYFEKLSQITSVFAARLQGKDRIILAETICGRSTDRTDGMIKEAFRLRRPEAANQLSGVVDRLLAYDEADDEQNQRRLKALEVNRQLKPSKKITASTLGSGC